MSLTRTFGLLGCMVTCALGIGACGDDTGGGSATEPKGYLTASEIKELERLDAAVVAISDDTDRTQVIEALNKACGEMTEETEVLASSREGCLDVAAFLDAYLAIGDDDEGCGDDATVGDCRSQLAVAADQAANLIASMKRDLGVARKRGLSAGCMRVGGSTESQLRQLERLRRAIVDVSKAGSGDAEARRFEAAATRFFEGYAGSDDEPKRSDYSVCARPES